MEMLVVVMHIAPVEYWLSMTSQLVKLKSESLKPAREA
jgi:hypothetical protein